MKIRFLVIFFLLLNFSAISQEEKDSTIVSELVYDENSQISPLQFNEERIAELKTQDAFDYLDPSEKENWYTRFKKWLSAKINQFLSWLLDEYEPSDLAGTIVQILVYLLLFSLVAFIIWLFIRLAPSGFTGTKMEEPGIFLSEEEELIKNEDLDKLIKNAIAEENYRLAVRYRYLQQLRELDKKELINYEFQKTNYEYVQEIAQNELKALFNRISTIYEYIWYGNFMVTKTDYLLAEKDFSKIENRLKGTLND